MKEILTNKLFGGFLVFIFVIGYSSTAYNMQPSEDIKVDEEHASIVYAK